MSMTKAQNGHVSHHIEYYTGETLLFVTEVASPTGYCLRSYSG